MDFALACSWDSALPSMMPGVTFSAPLPPPTPPVTPPAAVPALGLNYSTMRIDVYGNVKSRTTTQGITVTVY